MTVHLNDELRNVLLDGISIGYEEIRWIIASSSKALVHSR